jgi:hypothetical protein
MVHICSGWVILLNRLYSMLITTLLSIYAVVQQGHPD